MKNQPQLISLGLTLLAITIVVPFAFRRERKIGTDDWEAFHIAYAASVSALTMRIETFISEGLVKKHGLCEYPPVRRYAISDLDGDQENDLLLVTLFTFPNGGNYEESSLFVALSSRPHEVQRIILGGRGARKGRELLVDARGNVSVEFAVWGETDPMCCPSLSTIEQVKYENGGIQLHRSAEGKGHAQ